MQIIKWIILFLFTGILVPDSCRAVCTEETQVLSVSSATLLSEQTDNMFYSLVAMLRNNAGDLTEEVSHITPDKKAFIRLFVLLRYSKMPYPNDSRHTFLPAESFYPGQKQTAYYIYALEKILI